MLIRSVDEAQRTPVQMDGVKDASMALMIGREHGAPNFAMRSFQVAPGGHTPRHSHDYEHEVYVTKGSGTIFLGGQDNPIKAGDAILVPADEVHQFMATGDGPLEFLCFVPKDRNCGEPTPGS